MSTSSAHLTASVTNLDESAVAAPCGLPGWTRGHLLTHLARNADGLRRVLLSVRSGEHISMYSSSTARDADIAAGAKRPEGVIVEDFHLSTQAFAAEVALITEAQWAKPVQLSTVTGPSTVSARSVLEMRLREVEIHHVDLDVHYDFSTAATTTVDWLLRYAADRLNKQGPHSLTLEATDTQQSYTVNAATDDVTEPHAVRAPAFVLLRYLTGRALGGDNRGWPDPPAWG